MITRDEYNKALDIVEEYHKQLINDSFIDTLRSISKTRLYEWDKLNICSVRLQRLFEMIYSYENEYETEKLYIEDLKWQQFKKWNGAGRKSWYEFEDLRGY